MSRTVPAAWVRVLLTWTLVCVGPQTGVAGVLAAIEPPMVAEAADPPADPVKTEPPADDPVVVVLHDRGSRVRIGGSIVVDRGERVQDVVAILGSVTVRGEVTGSAVAVGGDVRVEDGGSVGDEVVAIGGRITASPHARISGRAEQVAIDFPEIVRIGPDGPDVTFRVLPDWPRVIGALTGLSFFRLGALLVLGLAVAMVFAPTVHRAADRAAAAPVEAFVIGLGLQVVVLPALVATCLALLVSIIGLPLVPVVLVVATGAWLVGFVGAVAAAGRGALRLVGRQEPSLLAGYILGGLPFAVLTLGSRLAWWSRGEMAGWPMTAALAGLVIEGVFWSLGAGALLLAWLRRPDPAAPAVTPPPAPPLPVQL